MVKIWRNRKKERGRKETDVELYAIEQQICKDNLNSGECCEGNCPFYGIDECIYPKKAIPRSKN